ncbi:MAG: class I SAM-dependent methyltransferase [Hyphomicrobium sp.]|nr:class I SAM-dependent methyltransferase [Hyphomicrobium sp.]
MLRSSAETAGSFSGFYAVKPASYFSNARSDFVDRLPRDPSAQILEIGCGTGATGALALSEGCCGRYVGVELFEDAAEEARDVLSEVIVGNVETLQLDWQPATFDAIILSEVLEHLVEPGEVLKRLARYVRPGGMLLASSPNISHWRVIRELVMGRFQLADQGVFDRTHLRWFTPGTFADLADTAGFDVEELGPVTAFSTRTELISKLTGGRFDHLFMTQIAMIARKR